MNYNLALIQVNSFLFVDLLVKKVMPLKKILII